MEGLRLGRVGRESGAWALLDGLEGVTWLSQRCVGRGREGAIHIDFLVLLGQELAALVWPLHPYPASELAAGIHVSAWEWIFELPELLCV